MLLALFAGARGDGLACHSSADCGGNPCCEYFPPPGLGSVRIVCGPSPSDCPPMDGVDTAQTRLCATSADCPAGLPGSTSTCAAPAPNENPHVQSCTPR